MNYFASMRPNDIWRAKALIAQYPKQPQAYETMDVRYDRGVPPPLDSQTIEIRYDSNAPSPQVVPLSTNDIWRAKALIPQYPKRSENTVENEREVALDFGEKILISPFAGKAKRTLDSLTNGAMSKSQIDALYGQITDHIEWDDMMKFKDINPESRPITLSPEQQSVLQGQIDRLTPDELRRAVEEQLRAARKNGVIGYPE
jgi:hypothetical protein